ncbi:MAG: zf-HC2 domain-containing protein [Longimicrobiales bacterium]
MINRDAILMIEYPAGVTCDVVNIRLERYLHRTLEWSFALEVAEHLESCVSCAERLGLLRLTRVARDRSPDD